MFVDECNNDAVSVKLFRPEKNIYICKNLRIDGKPRFFYSPIVLLVYYSSRCLTIVTCSQLTYSAIDESFRYLGSIRTSDDRSTSCRSQIPSLRLTSSFTSYSNLAVLGLLRQLLDIDETRCGVDVEKKGTSFYQEHPAWKPDSR